MECSLSAFFASGIAVSLMTLLLYLLLKRDKAVSRFGVVCLYLCVLLALARGFMPLDFGGQYYEGTNGRVEQTIHLTKSYYSTRLLPFLLTSLRCTLFSVGGVQIALKTILIGVWSAGTVFFLGRWLLGSLACKRRLEGMPEVEAPMRGLFGRVYQEIFPGKKDRCRVVISDLFGSAAVFGMIRPIIVIPRAGYSDQELYYIFRHELYHVKHKDHLVKNLCVLLAAIHWWDPLISCLFPKIVAQAQELLVDRSVVQGQGPQGRACYLECIKKTVQHALSARSKGVHGHALGERGSKRDVLQRFRLVIDQSVCGHTWKGILISLGIFMLSFTFVFEASFRERYDENGNEVFIITKDDSYFIKKGSQYDLYLDGRYYSSYESFSDVADDFKNLPIYKEGEK